MYGVAIAMKVILVQLLKPRLLAWDSEKIWLEYVMLPNWHVCNFLRFTSSH